MNSRLMIVVAILLLTASNSPQTGRFGGPPSPPRYDQRISPSCVYEVFSVPSRRPAVVARTGSQAIASIDVYGATSNRAAIIDFDSGPEFSLQVREVEEQIRIVISRLDRATGQFQQACEIQVKSRDERLIDNLRVSMAAAGPQRWRIRVFDPNTDGDTGMPPSLWLSEAGSLGFSAITTTPPTPPDYIQVVANPKLVSATICPVVARPVHQAATFVPLSQPMKIDDDFVLPQDVGVEGGKRVYLKLVVPAGVTIETTLSAKLPSLRSAQTVCSRRLTGPTSVYLSGQFPWASRGFKDLWVASMKSVSPSPQPFRISLQIFGESTDTSNSFTELTPTEAPLICIAETRAVRLRASSVGTARFAAARSVRINIIADGPAISPKGKEDVTQAIIAAFSVWRRGCQYCAKEQFSLIGIDDTIFTIRGIIDEKGNIFNGGASGLESGIGPNWNRIPFRGSSFEFSPVLLTASQLKDLCARTPLPYDAIDPRQTTVCMGRRGGPDNLVVNMVFRDRRLNCDQNPKTVACWNGSNLIELNGQDYRFFLNDPGQTIFGRGTHPVNLARVVAHEVGHWHGLGHIEAGASIMRGGLGSARCVGDETIAALAAVTSGRTPPLSNKAERLEYR